MWRARGVLPHRCRQPLSTEVGMTAPVREHATDADGWFTVDPVSSLSLKVEVYEAGLDRKTVRSRSRRWEGRVELKKTARKVSESMLVVPSGR